MKSTFILGLALLLFAASCKVLDKLTMFDYVNKTSVTIPVTAGLGVPLDLPFPDFAANLEESISINDSRLDLVESFQLTAMEINITDPVSADFSFLESLEIYINADSLGEVLIASKYNIDTAATSPLVMDVEEGVELEEFIKKANFNLRIEAVVDELITSDRTIEATSTFGVDAQVLGL